MRHSPKELHRTVPRFILMSTLRRFYFEIKEANILDYVTATTFLEAKQEAAKDYMHFWQQISWLSSTESADGDRSINDVSAAGSV